MFTQNSEIIYITNYQNEDQDIQQISHLQDIYVESHQQSVQIIQKKIKKKKLWTQQDYYLLMQIYDLYPDQWSKIAQQFPNRDKRSCMFAYKQYKNQLKKLKKRKCQSWKPDQDTLLSQIYNEYPEKWNKIRKYFPSRDQTQCYSRYRIINQINNDIRNREWTYEQDKLLLRLVPSLKYNWVQVSNHFENCNSSDCYARYKLRTNLGQSKYWTYEQDQKLLELYQKHINDWQRISIEFENKNKDKCKGRFIRLQCINSKKEWTDQEYELLQKKYKQTKGNWILITKCFKSFNQRECYFQYYRHKTQSLNQYMIKQRKKYKKIEKQKSLWTIQQDQLLMKLCKKNKKDWKKTYNEFGRIKSLAECKRRYSLLTYINNIKPRKNWTIEQDKILIETFRNQPYNWASIANKLTNCNSNQCYLRYRQILQKQKQLPEQIQMLSEPSIQQVSEKSESSIRQIKCQKIKKKFQKSQRDRIYEIEQIKNENVETVYKNIMNYILNQTQMLINFLKFNADGNMILIQ